MKTLKRVLEENYDMKKEFMIRSEEGLQANTAMKLVQKANQFSSDMTIQYGRKKVNLKSIMGVMSLEITKRAFVTITIEGEDEKQAFNAIARLFCDINRN
jgi:phosphocarrier protein